MKKNKKKKVVVCSCNQGYSGAHNQGTSSECPIAQYGFVAQYDFVAYHSKFVIQHNFVAQQSFVA